MSVTELAPLRLTPIYESKHVSRTRSSIPKRETMTSPTTDQLCSKKCVPCEGGVPKLSLPEAEALLGQLSGWTLVADGQRLRKQWVVKNFLAAMKFFTLVAEVAEAEGHHPDLHLERYRHITMEWWTHAIGGLSLNDFICAAKIDQLPIDLKDLSR